ncbi:MAG: creatininase family protein [Candidatus Methanomethylicia archaeon]
MEIKYFNSKKLIEMVRNDSIIVPVGSLEWHGPISTGSDSIIAEFIAKVIGSKLNIPVAPLIPYGFSNEHRELGFTISVSINTFKSYLYEILLEFIRNKVKNIIIVNGHGGNTFIIRAVITDLKSTYTNINIYLIDVWSIFSKVLKERFGNDVQSDHGGIVESSILAYVSDDVEIGVEIINELIIPKVPVPVKRLKYIFKPWLPQEVGNEFKASRKLGEILVNELISKVIDELRKELE